MKTLLVLVCVATMATSFAQQAPLAQRGIIPRLGTSISTTRHEHDGQNYVRILVCVEKEMIAMARMLMKEKEVFPTLVFYDMAPVQGPVFEIKMDEITSCELTPIPLRPMLFGQLQMEHFELWLTEEDYRRIKIQLVFFELRPLKKILNIDRSREV